VKAPDSDACFIVSHLGHFTGPESAWPDHTARRESGMQSPRDEQTGLVGNSAVLARVLNSIEQVASTDMTVLILGETGTGKELVARAIHQQSARASRPLIKVNCAALPGDLIESELFGHERGAFTGAAARRLGRFELAQNGTIFLDEIGDLPLSLQAKLLRVLQEGEFERLGSGRTIKVNARILAATNRSLQDAVAEGRFRADLYYRLNVYPITLPPLRERLDDIPLLAGAFLAEAERWVSRAFYPIPMAICEALQTYDWPGNVRELQNVIQRAALVSGTAELELPEAWRCRPAAVGVPAEAVAAPQQPSAPVTPVDGGASLSEVGRRYILQVLQQTRGRIEGPKGAAVILGLNPSTLRSRMRKLGIERPNDDEWKSLGRRAHT
jgi:transcriptional regulator with GAF, ATPase, and Fis domain